jgi:hypothetical protein
VDQVNNRVDLTMYTHGGRPIAELTQHLGVAEGTTIDIAEHVHLTYLGPTVLLSQDAPGVLNFLLSVGQSITAQVAASAAASWLCGKLKDRRPNVRITIEKTVVEVEAGQIKHVIEEKLTMERVRRHDK